MFKRADTQRQTAGQHAVDGMLESDPAHPILGEILGVAPASCWAFARVAPNADLETLYTFPVIPNAAELVADEFRRQRSRGASGPRIAAALRPLRGFAHAITMLFADERSQYGILMLYRTADLGAFTSSEINILSFALDVFSDRLSLLRAQPGSSNACGAQQYAATITRTTPDGAFYVLDRDLRIIMAWTPDDARGFAQAAQHTPRAERLPKMLEQTVRELSAGSTRSNAIRTAARPVSFLSVRTQPMSGPAGQYIGVRIDRSEPRNSLTGAAARFHISPREVQVLALLLDGNHLHQIAGELNITPSTVQDHIKNMLAKTGSGNRSELIARVLGWESAPRAGIAS